MPGSWERVREGGTGAEGPRSTHTPRQTGRLAGRTRDPTEVRVNLHQIKAENIEKFRVRFLSVGNGAERPGHVERKRKRKLNFLWCFSHIIWSSSLSLWLSLNCCEQTHKCYCAMVYQLANKQATKIGADFSPKKIRLQTDKSFSHFYYFSLKFYTLIFCLSRPGKRVTFKIVLMLSMSFNVVNVI